MQRIKNIEDTRTVVDNTSAAGIRSGWRTDTGRTVAAMACNIQVSDIALERGTAVARSL